MGHGDDIQGGASDNLRPDLVTGLSVLLQRPPAVTNRAVPDREFGQVVVILEYRGEGGAPVFPPVAVHPPDGAVAGIISLLMTAAVFVPFLPLELVDTGQCEAQGADGVGDQSLSIARFKRQLPFQPVGQDGHAACEGAHLGIGVPGQGQGGIQPGGQLQICADRVVQAGILPASGGGGEMAVLPQLV